MSLSLACIGLQNEGNLGAVARVMKNFGAEELLLIDTKIHPLTKPALDRASHAADILKNACTRDISVFKNYDLVVGTTAKVGTAYNIPRLPLTPQQLHEKVMKTQPKKILVVLGREDHGLSNKELVLCDVVVSIPVSKKYPVMNISHAAAIVLYELFTALNEQNSVSHLTTASKSELAQTLKLANEAVAGLAFPTDIKKRTQERLWKKLVYKSFLTKREAFVLMGFFKRVVKKR